MSKENAILFFEKIRADKHAAEILKNKEMPEDIKDKAKLFSEAAAELGEDIPAEDFAEAIEEIEEERRRKTDKAVSDMEKIDDDDLNYVAGGAKKNGCKAAHEGECEENDACDFVLNMYPCEENYNDNKCSFFNMCEGFFNSIVFGDK